MERKYRYKFLLNKSTCAEYDSSKQKRLRFDFESGAYDKRNFRLMNAKDMTRQCLEEEPTLEQAARFWHPKELITILKSIIMTRTLMYRKFGIVDLLLKSFL